jgi:hypothetical protein
LAPARKPARGAQPVTPIFQAVSAAAGSYTFTAQAVQALLTQANATALSVHLTQGMLNQSTNAQVGKILVSAGADDRVLLKVK